jgi:hypothetical protein
MAGFDPSKISSTDLVARMKSALTDPIAKLGERSLVDLAADLDLPYLVWILTTHGDLGCGIWDLGLRIWRGKDLCFWRFAIRDPKSQIRIR